MQTKVAPFDNSYDGELIKQMSITDSAQDIEDKELKQLEEDILQSEGPDIAYTTLKVKNKITTSKFYKVGTQRHSESTLQQFEQMDEEPTRKYMSQTQSLFAKKQSSKPKVYYDDN